MEEITESCPFCGTPSKCEDGEHELNMTVVITGTDRPYAVGCIMCGSRGPESNTEQEAIEEWNRRA